MSNCRINWAFFKAISPYTCCGTFSCHFFGTMQQNTTKFGVVVAANSSCLHLDLDLYSSFGFDVVSVSLCAIHIHIICTCMVKVVMHASVLGNVLMAFLHNCCVAKVSFSISLLSSLQRGRALVWWRPHPLSPAPRWSLSRALRAATSAKPCKCEGNCLDLSCFTSSLSHVYTRYKYLFIIASAVEYIDSHDSHCV